MLTSKVKQVVNIEHMRKEVAEANENTPFPPSYAAAYIGKSIHTLQYMRCHDTEAIVYSKIGRHVVYRKRHLDEYLDRCERKNTSF